MKTLRLIMLLIAIGFACQSEPEYYEDATKRSEIPSIGNEAATESEQEQQKRLFQYASAFFERAYGIEIAIEQTSMMSKGQLVNWIKDNEGNLPEEVNEHHRQALKNLLESNTEVTALFVGTPGHENVNESVCVLIPEEHRDENLEDMGILVISDDTSYATTGDGYHWRYYAIGYRSTTITKKLCIPCRIIGSLVYGYPEQEDLDDCGICSSKGE